MRKLIRGIVDFRKEKRPLVKETFAQLALGQRPDTFFVACSDSRVVPNLFASTEPGDLFVLRNVGNIIPPCEQNTALSAGDVSEIAALEFAIINLGVKDIVVCGHSECGATLAILREPDPTLPTHIKAWVKNGEKAREYYEKGLAPDKTLAPHNQISQLNVLVQIDHIKSYPVIQKAIANKQLAIHGWWFDIAKAEVLSYDEDQKRFVVIDEEYSKKLLD